MNDKRARSLIHLVPGKTNLKELGYSMVGDFTSNDLAPAWDLSLIHI